MSESRSPSAAASRPKWHYIYFVLAAFDLFTVSISLYLSHQAMQIFSRSVSINHTWAERLNRYSELGELASEVNAPGNDVFDSHDVAGESARMRRGLDSFNREFHRLRAQIEAKLDAVAAAPLLKQFDAVDAAMHEMTAEAELIFSFFEVGKPDEAGKRMATMDRKYARVNSALARLRRAVAVIQEENLVQQTVAAEKLQRYEYLIAALIVMMVLGATFYGHRIAKQVQASAEERERHLHAITAAQSRARALLEELSAKKEEAERANLAKSRLIAAASHDLRQPMHAIGLFVGALREKIQYPEVRDIVDKLQASVEAMDDLLNALLDTSKLDAGILAPQVGDFEVRSLLNRMELQFAAQAKHKGLEFHVVPSSAVVRSDPLLLDRIVRNLVANAVQHTAYGRIIIGCRRRRNTVGIQVWDTGPGIPKEHLEDIFQEFYQLHHSEVERHRGLGLGLSIVRRIANLLGHPIQVRSAMGRGSCFGVEVPLGDQPEKLELDLELVGDQGDSVYGSFIVVVDDDYAVLSAMEALLTQWGCHVVTAGSAAEAVTKLARHERLPDLIISDYRLLDRELGTDAIMRIRAAQESDIPGVLITGDTAPAVLKEAAASGFPLIHKPVSAEKLRAVLASVRVPGTQAESA